MNVAWLTPLSQSTGISKYSLSVIPELSERCSLDVWAESAEDDYRCSCDVRELRVDSATVRTLATYDAVVYNMGNNASFHAAIHHMSEAVPGVMVIHDRRMQDFFFNKWVVVADERERYVAMMRYYYGVEGENAALEVLDGQRGLNEDQRWPLVEPLLWNATGAVVHSSHGHDAVTRYGDLLPVAEIPLPFSLSAVPCLGALSSRADLVPDDGRVLLVSTGGVMPHKRLESLIDALAATPELLERARLAIIGDGPPQYLAALRERIAGHGVEKIVHLTGRVDDAALYSWIAASDVAINLRYPATESASLSMVEQLSFGKPAVVSDTSYYHDLPDELAKKIPVDECEIEALGEALSELVSDAGKRASMGTAARSFYLEYHTPRVYVQRLSTFLEGVAGLNR